MDGNGRSERPEDGEERKRVDFVPLQEFLRVPMSLWVLETQQC